MLTRRSPAFSQPPLGSAALIAFLAAAVIVATSAWQLCRTRSEILEHAGDDVRVLSHALAQHAARTIEAVDLTLEDVAEHAARSGASTADLTSYIRQRVARLGQIRNLAVVRADGSWVADALSVQTPTSSADRKYFVWHRDHTDAGLHIDDLIASRTTGKPSIPLSRRFDNADGSFGGVVIATLAPEYLNEFYRQVRNGERGTVAVWLQDGRLLNRYPNVSNPQPEAMAAATFYASALFKAEAGISRSVSPFDGVERLFAFEHLDGLPLVVSASVSTQDTLMNWRHDAATEGMVVGFSALLLIVLGCGLEAHRRRISVLLVDSQATDERFRMLANNTSDMITQMALDGTRIYVSPASRELLGQEPEALVGTNPKDTVHPDDAAQLRSVLDKLVTGVTDHAVNINRLRHCDRGWIWVEASLRLLRDDAGRPSSIVAAVRNIMDRQQAIEALRKSEARYRMLADTTSDVITQLDLNFERRYVSPSCRVLLGYEPEEMLGVRPSESIHPDEAPRARELAEHLVAGKVEGDRGTVTHRVRHKDGHWVWVEASINLVRDQRTGAAQSLICSLRDVTERQRVARHLEQAKAAAENAARQKSEFVANMSHELRTPLTGILGLHDLLQADPTLGAKQRRYLLMARDAGRSLLSIVNDVLDFSKIEAGELTIEKVPFSLFSLVEACEDMTVEAARAKSLRFDIKMPDGPVTLLGDAARLKQILLNLLTNAVKFTDQGGVNLTVRYSPETARLRFEVSDTGIGIPEAKLPLIFKRFNQADTSITRRYGGTGLGLAICKRLVELMSGQIGVTSAPGQGSTFWFEIPTHDVPRDTGQVENPKVGKIVPRRILLAEDNPVNQEVIKAMLETRGNDVVLVDNGAAAAAAATRAQPAYQIILMDLQMPIMDGLTATRAIRAAEQSDGRAATPIIGLTANAMVEDVNLCLQAGMDAHVAKPIDWAELFTAMDRVTSASDQDREPVVADTAAAAMAEVLDVTKLKQLAAVIGANRVAKMLRAFVLDVERRLADLDSVDEKELAARVHTIVSLAGQFGFSELSLLCARIEDETRTVTGRHLLADLRSVGERALDRAQTFTFDHAA